MATTVITTDKSGIDRLHTFLKDKQCSFDSLNYGFFKASGTGYSVSAYNSGKIVIQGKDIESLISEIGNILYSNEKTIPHIGIDEAGKGDYFGPLVISAVYIDDQMVQILRTLGLRDGKTIKDRDIYTLADSIMNVCPYETISISPGKYNQLIQKFGNLNHLLAWGHARSLESLLEKQPCDTAISDQFASSKETLKKALMPLGKKIHLIQKTKAESEPAVAAASILARARFLKDLKFAGNKAGLTLPKGAGPAVDSAARNLYKSGGMEALSMIAKIHFKTTEKIKAP